MAAQRVGKPKGKVPPHTQVTATHTSNRHTHKKHMLEQKLSSFMSQLYCNYFTGISSAHTHTHKQTNKQTNKQGHK